MAEGRSTPAERFGLRAAAPHQGGPLGSSGAAPDGSPPTADQSAAAKAAPATPAQRDLSDKSDIEPGTPSPPERDDSIAESGDAAAPTSARPEADPTADQPPSPADGTTDSAPGAPSVRPSAISADPPTTAAPATPSAAADKTAAASTAAASTAVGNDQTAADKTAAAGSAQPAADKTAAAGSDQTALDKPAAGSDQTAVDKPLAAGTAAGSDQAAASSSAPRRRNPVRRVAGGVGRAGRGIGRAGRGTVAWAKRPSGRLILPAVVVLLLVGGAIVAGAYYVPQKLKASPAASATPVFPGGAAAPVPSASLPGELPSAGLPGGGVPSVPATGVTQPPAAGTGQRPADVLAGWAETTGTRVGIPVVAVEAYGYAELVLARTMPTCHLSWTTLAAIAEVESNHGHFQTSVLGADGTVSPPIYGLPLNGQGGRALIKDTDHGVIDGDPTYDRAVGPLQFVPSTWAAYKVDADNSGVADPQNINDASLTAGIYLCQKGRDLSKPDDWYSAIFSYNAVQPYAEKVFQTANDYGQRSRA